MRDATLSKFLRKVLHRDVKTFYTISEVLECGHRFDGLTLLADPLVAKYRSCPACAKAIQFPPKKAPQSEKEVRDRQSKVSGGRYDPPFSS